MIHDTQSAQISQKRNIYERNIYVIMKTMCPPGYHHNGFVATHALRYMMYGYIGVSRAGIKSNNIYIYIYIYIYIGKNIDKFIYFIYIRIQK